MTKHVAAMKAFDGSLELKKRSEGSQTVTGSMKRKRRRRGWRRVAELPKSFYAFHKSIKFSSLLFLMRDR